MKQLLLICMLAGLYSSSYSASLELTVFYDQAQRSDTLFLEYNTSFFPGIKKPDRVAASMGPDGSYRFSLKTADTLTFSVKIRRQREDGNHEYNPILYRYEWIQGAPLRVNIVKRPGSKGLSPRFDFYYSFLGKDAIRYRAKAAMDSSYYFTSQDTSSLGDYIGRHRGRVLAGLSRLQQYRDSLNGRDYDLYKADLIYRNAAETLGALRSLIKTLSPRQQQEALAGIDSFFDRGFPDELLAFSREYVAYFYQRKLLDLTMGSAQVSMDSVITKLIGLPQSLLTDRQIVYFLHNGKPSRLAELILAASERVLDPDARMVLDLLSGRGKGSLMMDFEFPDQDGKLVKLSDFRGNIVLVDLWFSGCGGCLGYFRDVLSKVEPAFHGKNVKFITISADTEKRAWKRSVESGKYTSSLATNLYTAGQGFNFEMAKRYAINTYPTLILIDPKGYIIGFNTAELQIRSAENLMKILNEAGGR